MTYQRSLLQDLGIDPESFDWRQLSSCRGLDINLFFDDYDGAVARQIDQLCLNCPVGKECFLDAQEFEDEGVRCGFYLINGKPDPTKNSHKTKEMAAKLANKIYED